jgi:hypothetical protein
MKTLHTGWKRFGISTSLIWWVITVIFVIFEWITVPKPEGYFVKAEGYLSGNEFADLVPVVPHLKYLTCILWLFLPVLCFWLIFFLVFWVIEGFKNLKA